MDRNKAPRVPDVIYRLAIDASYFVLADLPSHSLSLRQIFSGNLLKLVELSLGAQTEYDNPNNNANDLIDTNNGIEFSSKDSLDSQLPNDGASTSNGSGSQDGRDNESLDETQIDDGVTDELDSEGNIVDTQDQGRQVEINNDAIVRKFENGNLLGVS
ncbi:hypothetical protein QAD02_014825 [Eretmocerus hayati]|uniref:Uncharacterized protein n=1 Tax=Eretmocerus hayati TaxID=131215 RepID=A0ACC2P7G8_9HYME|nr:hypothetical protein QAD02_014825 [Eretmocerus hayati]